MSNHKRLTKKECEDRNKLYEYIEQKVLHYDEETHLVKWQVLQIDGLLHGKFIANNNSENKRNYSYEVVLNTFKICQPKIQRALSTVEFNGEKHKLSYILKIIADNLNDVNTRMKQKEKVISEIENNHDTILTSGGVKYEDRPRPEKVLTDEDFEDMW